MLAKNNGSRVMAANNVVDARLKLLHKALVQPAVLVDARQKLTKQKDAREKIQERRSHLTSHDVSKPCSVSIVWLILVYKQLITRVIGCVIAYKSFACMTT